MGEVASHFWGSGGRQDLNRVGVRLIGHRQAAIHRPAIGYEKSNDRQQTQLARRTGQMVMYGDNPRDPFESGQEFEARFIILQAGQQIDMHEQGYVR